MGANGHATAPLGIADDARVVVVTGAGISAESGLATFRDPDGIWARYDLEQVATPQGFAADPDFVWRFYGERRADAEQAQPNAGHRAIASLAARLAAGGGELTLITQNVDGLHALAGPADPIEIHGNLYRTRCSRRACARGRLAWPDREAYLDGAPPCCDCGAPLRPDVVWFGEMLDPALSARAERSLARCDWFVAVGTSGAVWPVAGYVHDARSRGARTVLVNLEAADNARAFEQFARGPAAELLPALFR